jgi:hypothetical protein
MRTILGRRTYYNLQISDVLTYYARDANIMTKMIASFLRFLRENGFKVPTGHSALPRNVFNKIITHVICRVFSVKQANRSFFASTYLKEYSKINLFASNNLQCPKWLKKAKLLPSPEHSHDFSRAFWESLIQNDMLICPWISISQIADYFSF